jgi:hypothetical protein
MGDTPSVHNVAGSGLRRTHGERGPGLSWQEELRKLDEELAAGQISADDYRVRRDQVLSSAVSLGSTGQPPAPQPKGEATQFIQQPSPFPAPPDPAKPPQPMPPQPPVPMAPPPPGPPSSSDKTQVVGTNQTDADKTQIVTDQGQGWQTARPGGPDSERTQVVPGIPGVPPQTVAGGQPPRPAPGVFPQQQGFPPPPGWQPQSEEDLSPPWAGSTFPPLGATGSPDWARQGPEVFEDNPSGAGKRVLLILLVVLVLGGIGAGVYFLVINKKDDPGSRGNGPQTSQSPPSSQGPTTTTSKKPTDPNLAILEEMPLPPASLQQDGKVLPVEQLVGLKLMDAPEVQLLTTAGVKQVPWRTALRKPPEDGPTADALSAMVIPTASAEAAKKLVQDLRTYQESVGLIFIPEPLPNMPPSVVFEKKITAEVALYRGLYVSGKNVVRITTIQAPLSNEASLSGSYRNHTEVMIRTFPPE